MYATHTGFHKKSVKRTEKRTDATSSVIRLRLLFSYKTLTDFYKRGMKHAIFIQKTPHYICFCDIAKRLNNVRTLNSRL